MKTSLAYGPLSRPRAPISAGMRARKNSPSEPNLHRLLLKDAARLLQLDRGAYDEEGGYVEYHDLHHHLIPVQSPPCDTPNQVACYMLRLPLRLVEPQWSTFMLELNMALVPNTGLCIGAHSSIGLGLLCRLAEDELNPYTLADVMQTASTTVAALLNHYWGGELPR